MSMLLRDLDGNLMCIEDTRFEQGRGEGSALCYEYGIHGAPVQFINKGQRCHASMSRMYTGVQDDCYISVLKNTT